VRLVVFHELVLFAVGFEIAVEVCVCEKVFRRIGSLLEETSARFRPAQIARAIVFQHAARAVVAAGLIGCSDNKRPAGEAERIPV
jgi:hypothetical protein